MITRACQLEPMKNLAGPTRDRLSPLDDFSNLRLQSVIDPASRVFDQLALRASLALTESFR